MINPFDLELSATSRSSAKCPFTKLKRFHMPYSVTDVANRTDISSTKIEMKTFTNKNLNWLLHKTVAERQNVDRG